MRQTKLFTKTRKNAPTDEEAVNAKLLIRGGFIHKELAGVYSFLPLGLLTLNKINNIIRDEMNKVGGMELHMSSLQDKNVWQKTGRFDDSVVDIWFKTNFKSGGETSLAFTHEEPVTRLMKDHIQSFRDLPAFPFHFQTKFRNETRAKSGIMRTKEFLMKDLYSFSKDEIEHNEFYEKMKQAYLNVFDRIGIGDKTFITYASGGSFSQYSHEFQTLAENGEDTIFICEKCKVAINQDIVKQKPECPECKNTDVKEQKAVEVGNIFSLGTKFSNALDLNFVDENGEKKPVIMGSYGIGPARVMGTVVELLSDEKGIIWPKNIAPFKIHLIQIGKNSKESADKFYELCLAKIGRAHV